MRVCHVLSTLAPSGPVTQVLDTVRGLDCEAIALTLSPEPADSASDAFRAAGVEVTTLGLSRPTGFVLGPRRLADRLDAIDPDVVHVHGVRASLLAAVAARDHPRVATMHTDPLWDYPLLYGRLGGTLLARLHYRALARLDRVVACSEAVADRARRRGLSPRVIRNGVDASRYAPAVDAERARLRDRLDLPADRTVHVSVGAFVRRKRPLRLVRGFLSSDAADGTLVLVGDGPLREDCLDLAADEPAVRLPGRVDDVVPYLRAADYFLSASAAEGLPLAAVEALGCGLPVGLSDIPPHAELLGLDERVGRLFDADRPAGVAAGIDDLLGVDREAASAAARGLVVERLNAGRMAGEYRACYEELADR